MTRWLHFGMFLLTLTAVAAVAASPEQVGRWIKELDDEDFGVRERATQELAKAGKPALEPLKQAALGKNLEVSTRAIRALLEQARSSQAEQAQAARAVLKQLAGGDHPVAAGEARAALKSFLTDIAAKLEKKGATIIWNGDSLTAVNFDNAKDFHDELALLHELPDLTLISMSNPAVDDKAIEKLQGLAKLESLNLYQSRISDAGLPYLKKLPALRWLPMGETLVTDKGLMHLAGLTQLEYLGLRGNQVSDDGLVHLGKLTNLTGLYLGETRVTDKGLVHLRGLTKLANLKLDTVNVGDAGLEQLAALKSLQTLTLWDTKVSDDGVAKLQKALPSLEVARTRR